MELKSSTKRKQYIPDLSSHDLIVIDYINTMIAIRKISKRQLARTLNVNKFQVYNPLLKRAPLTPQLKKALFKELGISTDDIDNLVLRMKASIDA